MSHRDAEYFADRALVEMAMSRAATDPRAASAHAEMAARYERLAADFRPQRSALKVVA